jgi:GTP cyclohydrolase IA
LRPRCGWRAILRALASVPDERAPEAPIDLGAVAEIVRSLLAALGEDPDRDGLRETPRRVAEMYVELLGGLWKRAEDELTTRFSADHDEMILLKDIPLYSICEHHFLPFLGQAHVAYIPDESGTVVGLSKLARAVDTLARRPQVQERLTTQIADVLERSLEARGVLVVIEAEHLCMSMRGIQKAGSRTVTSAVRGMFAEQEATRAEAMSLIFHG